MARPDCYYKMSLGLFSGAEAIGSPLPVREDGAFDRVLAMEVISVPTAAGRR